MLHIKVKRFKVLPLNLPEIFQTKLEKKNLHRKHKFSAAAMGMFMY